MEKFQPNFDRLRQVLLRQGEPDIVPFFDLYPSYQFIETITGKPYSTSTLVEFFYTGGYDYVYSEIGLTYPENYWSRRPTSVCRQQSWFY